VFAAAAVASAVALGGASSAHSQVIEELHAALPQEYRDNGIDVAVFNDWPPDEYVENGELKGWSVELAREISERLGVEFHFAPIGFDGIIPGLVGGRYDLGVSSFGATEERLQSLDFIAQRYAGTGFAVKAGSDLELATEEDLCGTSVAIIAGSWDHQLLEGMNTDVCAAQQLEPIDIQQFPTQAAAELSVTSGRTDSTAAASAKLRFLAQQTGDFDVETLVVEAVLSCLGVRRGDPLGPIITDAIQAIIDDGTYMEIMTRWGLEDDGPIDQARLITAENFAAE
tara:strand:- start:4099 stop:4950 length:852 start_codon:yes stop_codon:yes gene_type:complete